MITNERLYDLLYWHRVAQQDHDEAEPGEVEELQDDVENADAVLVDGAELGVDDAEVVIVRWTFGNVEALRAVDTNEGSPLVPLDAGATFALVPGRSFPDGVDDYPAVLVVTWADGPTERFRVDGRRLIPIDNDGNVVPRSVQNEEGSTHDTCSL